MAEICMSIATRDAVGTTAAIIASVLSPSLSLSLSLLSASQGESRGESERSFRDRTLRASTGRRIQLGERMNP